MLINLDYRNHADCKEEDNFTRRVRLFTGYKCNYRCNFCFYKGQTSKCFDDGIKKQASLAKIHNIDSLDISGGEPTILSNWNDILEHLKILGFKNLAAITNGSTFHHLDFLEESISSGLNEVLFSYHGPSPELHDSMTGIKGSYKRLFNSMCNAVDLGLKIRVNTVVTRNNYKYLPDIAKDMLDIKPDAFNFLPFRLENQSTSDNMVSYSESCEYIKQAIDIMNTSNIFISVRYIPYCVMEGYERYVCGWIQKLFDPYEWSQRTFDCLENVRLEREIPGSCFSTKKSLKDLEFAATYDAIKATSGYSTRCIKYCSHKWICEGIWKTYANVYGVKEFNPIPGVDVDDVMQYRRRYVRSFFNNKI